jgi:hypothetical protein
MTVLSVLLASHGQVAGPADLPISCLVALAGIRLIIMAGTMNEAASSDMLALLCFALVVALVTAPSLVLSVTLAEFWQSSSATLKTADLAEFCHSSSATLKTADLAEFCHSSSPTLKTADLAEFCHSSSAKDC